MYRAYFDIIYWPKVITDFMQSADVFGLGRVVWEMQSISVWYKREITFESATSIMRNIIKWFEASGNIVSYVNLKKIQNNNIIELNQWIVEPYINEKVKTVSNWENFYLLNDIIKWL